MNSIIYLCVFGIVFNVQVQAEDKLFQDVEYLKNHVNSIRNNLSNIEKNLTFDFYVKLSMRKIRNYEYIDDLMSNFLTIYVNSTEADAATKQETSHCYELAEKYLDSKRELLHKELDKCIKNRTSDLDDLLGDIRHYLQMGESIHNDLNFLVLDCCSTTSMHVESCLSERVPVMRDAVVQYELPVERLENHGVSLLYFGAMDYSHCADSAVRNFANYLFEVDSEYAQCVVHPS